MLAMHPIITALLPELTLVIGASLILLLGMAISSNGRQTRPAVAPGVILLLALLTVAGALHLSWRLGGDRAPTPSLLQDPLVWYVRLATLSVGLLLLLVNHHVPEAGERSENAAMILVSLAGVLLVAEANDLISLFLALEVVSIPTYVLIGLSRRNLHAQEATAKYFFLGSFAAALTLYGFSFLYGAAGTMRLFTGADTGGSIHLTLARPEVLADPLVIVGLALAIGGLLFKIAAVPLHFYVADVYHGAASPVAGLLGFVPKFAGFVALIRLFSLTGWAADDAIFWLLWVLAAATMFVGNTLALMQHNAKRILAYSGIAHTGYMLVALLAGPIGPADAGPSPLQNGLSALLFYIPVYGVMNLGAFVALAFFRKTGPDGDDSAESLQDLAGAARRHPWACLSLTVCTLGLMGFPLTGGFLAKLYILSSALAASPQSGTHGAMVALVVLAVINSAIGAAYYIRILAACYLRPSQEVVTPSSCPALRLGLGLCAIAVLLVFLLPGSLIAQSKAAVRAILPQRPAVIPSAHAQPDRPRSEP